MSMNTIANQRVAYFNGRYVPENEVLVPFRDRSFVYGDAGFDVTRTFNHVPYRLAEHVARLYRSLKYLRIEPGLTAEEMIAVSAEVIERNKHLIGDGDDYWLTQRVSRGVDAVGDEGWEHTGPNVIVECKPLPLKQRAPMYRDGIALKFSSVRRTSPDALTPRAKTHNYLNLIMADLEVKDEQDPLSWTMLLDVNGNLCEAFGSNIFLVQGGTLLTPREQFVLPGISRQTVIDLAAELDIPCLEKDLDTFDAATADEVFLTSTAFCVCPVHSVNGAVIGDGTVPGPMTARLLKAYSDLAGLDIAGQYLSRLD
jgi:branched-chain amino acid aminotransferase